VNIISHSLTTISQNLGQQLMHISRMETTYFDSEGRGAYNKRRWLPLLIIMLHHVSWLMNHWNQGSQDTCIVHLTTFTRVVRPFCIQVHDIV